MNYEDYNEIVWQPRRDKTTGELVAMPIHQEDMVNPLNGIVCLREIPDEFNRIVVKDENGVAFREVGNSDEIKNSTDFYVNYGTRKMFFHRDVMGEKVIIDFYGIGCEYLSCSAIFTKLDQEGNVVELLSDIIEKGREYIRAVDTFGGAVVVMNSIDSKVELAEKTLDKTQNMLNIS